MRIVRKEIVKYTMEFLIDVHCTRIKEFSKEIIKEFSMLNFLTKFKTLPGARGIDSKAWIKILCFMVGFYFPVNVSFPR